MSHHLVTANLHLPGLACQFGRRRQPSCLSNCHCSFMQVHNNVSLDSSHLQKETGSYCYLVAPLKHNPNMDSGSTLGPTSFLLQCFHPVRPRLVIVPARTIRCRSFSTSFSSFSCLASLWDGRGRHWKAAGACPGQSGPCLQLLFQYPESSWPSSTISVSCTCLGRV